MIQLTNKRILLGVTGSIAAYKSAELVRLLTDAGADVQVVMTQAAQAFITPLTLQTLSNRPVHTQLMDLEAESTMGHIALARWADVLLIAPASADFMARLAQGKADDLLAAIALATDTPLLVAPAMNQQMWRNTATGDNVKTLVQRGVKIIGPAEGVQACGETGPGRMVEPQRILEAVASEFAPGLLSGLNVLVTAGPTREAIDPVRYISNRSSGKMGFAVAEAAVEAGARVTLISGPVTLATPERVRRIDIESAEQMMAQVEAHMNDCDVFIAAAAVADYHVAEIAQEKIKKQAPVLALVLSKTIDVLATVSARPVDERPFCVGFAAETQDLIDNAHHKLKSKGLDMIAANRVGGDTGGFDVDENTLTLLWHGGEHVLPLESKPKLARQLIAKIAERYYEKNTVKNPG